MENGSENRGTVTAYMLVNKLAKHFEWQLHPQYIASL